MGVVQEDVDRHPPQRRADDLFENVHVGEDVHRYGDDLETRGDTAFYGKKRNVSVPMVRKVTARLRGQRGDFKGVSLTGRRYVDVKVNVNVNIIRKIQ